MSVLCSVSECIHCNLPEEAHVPVTLLKTWINLINLNQAHLAKLSWHDFTDLHVKLCFYGEQKRTAEMGRNNRFISITVFSKSLEAEIETDFQLIEQPYKELHSSP